MFGDVYVVLSLFVCVNAVEREWRRVGECMSLKGGRVREWRSKMEVWKERAREVSVQYPTTKLTMFCCEVHNHPQLEPNTTRTCTQLHHTHLQLWWCAYQNKWLELHTITPSSGWTLYEWVDPRLSFVYESVCSTHWRHHTCIARTQTGCTVNGQTTHGRCVQYTLRKLTVFAVKRWCTHNLSQTQYTHLSNSISHTYSCPGLHIRTAQWCSGTMHACRHTITPSSGAYATHKPPQSLL